MNCCRPATSLTPLEKYVERRREEGDSTPEAPLLFPMYAVPLEAVLRMTRIQPHEVLRSRGVAVEFKQSLGKAAFVSHQWVGDHHPDPEFKQFRVLQEALGYMLTELENIEPDFFSEVICKCEPLPTAAFKTSQLFVWYDYFCCPQLNKMSNGDVGGANELARAVSSIPSYVAQCKFFFALCPVVETERLSQVFSPYTWAQRGWCRAEAEMRSLSPDPSWILIKSGRVLELVSSFGGASGGPAGDGLFTVEEDRGKLTPVLRGALERKLHCLLNSGDLVGYRVLLNMQAVHLRNLPLESLLEPVPGFDASLSPRRDDASVAAAQFMYQNGFGAVQEVDAGGWFPLHYAALGGDPLVMQGLLSQRADPNCQTQKEQPRSGTAPFTTALTICVFHKHNEAASLLISAGAALHLGLTPALHAAAHANNPDAIRLLLQAGFDPSTRDVMGWSAVLPGCCFGSLAAIEELCARHAFPAAELSLGLLCGAAAYGGSADFVTRLVELRADVNHQRQVPLLPAALYDILEATHNLRHRLGNRSAHAAYGYHCHGMTPLMCALLFGQHECAAALIAAGAGLHLVNSRNWAAEDFVRGQSLPEFLLAAFQGHTDACRRLVAWARGYVEERF